MNEGDYGIQGRSIQDEDKAIYRFSNSTQGTIIYCPGVIPPPTSKATWEVQVRGGTYEYSGQSLSPRFQQGTRYYATPYRSDSYASLSERTIPALGKALGNSGYVGIDNVSWNENGRTWSSFAYTPNTTFDRTVTYPMGRVLRPLQGDTQITDLGFNIYLSDFVPGTAASIWLGDSSWGYSITFSGGNGVLPPPGSYKFRMTELKSDGTENVIRYYPLKEGSFTEYDYDTILDTVTTVVPNPVKPYPAEPISGNDEETVRYLNNSNIGEEIYVKRTTTSFGFTDGVEKDITLNTGFSLVTGGGYFIKQSMVEVPSSTTDGSKWRVELMEYIP